MNPIDELKLFLTEALKDEPVGNEPIVWALATEWKNHVNQYMDAQEEAWHRQNAISVAMGLEIDTYFKDRRTYFIRASKVEFAKMLAWDARTATIDSTKELNLREAAMIERWLRGHHPTHEENSLEMVQEDLEIRHQVLCVWLYLHEEEILGRQERYRTDASISARRQAEKAVVRDLLATGETTLQEGTKQYILFDSSTGVPVITATAMSGTFIREHPPITLAPDVAKEWQHWGAPLRAVKIVEDGEWVDYDGSFSMSKKVWG